MEFVSYSYSIYVGVHVLNNIILCPILLNLINVKLLIRLKLRVLVDNFAEIEHGNLDLVVILGLLTVLD